MCGISLIFSQNSNEMILNYDQLNYECLNRRGPDVKEIQHVDVTDDWQLRFEGCVLHLRGTATPQPLKDVDGNVILWNGEIFRGICVGECENDTEVLSRVLQSCSCKQEILDVFSSIEGPWSFIYWQAKSRSLWFGRDVLGRRSLLWHLPSNVTEDVFALSSVQLKPLDFEEVPCHGIYRIQFDERETSPQLPYHIELTPWRHLLPDTTATNSLSPMYISINADESLSCVIQALDTTVPEHGHQTLAPLQGEDHLQYLHHLLRRDDRMSDLATQFIEVLQEAVSVRVSCLTRHNVNCVAQLEFDPSRKQSEISHRVCEPSCTCTDDATELNNKGHISPPCAKPVTAVPACVAVLYSGGIDSAVIAALADRVAPRDEPIDLLNVAFEQQPKPVKFAKNKPLHNMTPEDNFSVPDRITGLASMKDLSTHRKWNFVQINVTLKELQTFREERVKDLIYPLCSVLDDSIGCALWCAARGQGWVVTDDGTRVPYLSPARVVLVGMGADEQLAGYSRHRSIFLSQSWAGLMSEIQMEVARISARNLGRDDRIISDHGRESRYPFLDERVVSFLNQTPVQYKCDLHLPRGLGEKLLLRLAAVKLGLSRAAVLPKRAIQFGSRIAKLENSGEKASDICARLSKTAILM